MNSEGELIVHIDNFMGADQWVRVNSGWPDLTPKVIKEFFPYLRYVPEGEVRFSPKIARHTFHARLKKLAFPILRDKPFSAPNFVADLRRDFDRKRLLFISCTTVLPSKAQGGTRFSTAYIEGPST